MPWIPQKILATSLDGNQIGTRGVRVCIRRTRRDHYTVTSIPATIQNPEVAQANEYTHRRREINHDEQ